MDTTVQPIFRLFSGSRPAGVSFRVPIALLLVGMHPDLAEVVAKARLEIPSRLMIERLARRVQHLVNNRERSTAIGCERVNESRPVGKVMMATTRHREAGHQKPHFHPIEKVRESKFKGF